MQFQQKTLDNGLTIVGEVNLLAHSMAVGFFVRAGSRDETPELAGVSHFLEHMAFKGNSRFSADDVNRIFDEVGAKYNASTSEEVTLFYAAILPEYLPRTFELLANLLRPGLRESDFALEQQVILEEIGMYEDAPGFLVYDRAMQTHYAGHPLGQRILGTSDSVSRLTPDAMRGYFDAHYRAGNIVLVATGKFDWEQLVQLAAEYCGGWPTGDVPRSTERLNAVSRTDLLCRPSHRQQHVMQLAPAPSARDPLRFAADILSVIVGDDSGSRLYWELVDPGHAESAELAYNDYDGEGTWCTYLSCEPDDTSDLLRRIGEIYADINANGVTADELEEARNNVATRVVLSSERPMGRLSAVGGNWVYRGEYRTVEDDLLTLKRMTIADIRQMLDQYPLAQTTTVGIGPLTKLSETDATS
ncbi:MAG: pitrilysin family protein [Planctomycetaceae bacterium]